MASRINTHDIIHGFLYVHVDLLNNFYACLLYSETYLSVNVILSTPTHPATPIETILQSFLLKLFLLLFFFSFFLSLSLCHHAFVGCLWWWSANPPSQETDGVGRWHSQATQESVSSNSFSPEQSCGLFIFPDYNVPITDLQDFKTPSHTSLRWLEMAVMTDCIKCWVNGIYGGGGGQGIQNIK